MVGLPRASSVPRGIGTLVPCLPATPRRPRVAPGASADEVRAAWRSLARQHHPDLTADDPEAARRATRRMAEINAAYAALTKPESAAARKRRHAEDEEAIRPTPRPGAGVPPPPKTKPVTARVDMSSTVLPRNQTTTPPGCACR
ncbi:MAG: DnaJ domain-containing protein [Chloroflexota bacterium]